MIGAEQLVSVAVFIIGFALLTSALCAVWESRKPKQEHRAGESDK